MNTNTLKLTARRAALVTVGGLLALSAAMLAGRSDARQAWEVPPPAIDATANGEQTVIFAGGCFWGVQGVFQHTAGVKSAVSGYSGGTLANPGYEQVTSGLTGHAEAVKVTFDPAVVSYGKLLQIFFSVVHDPTQLNRQENDVGTQYRSAIFTTIDDQASVAKAYIAQLDAAKIYGGKIVTDVKPVDTFYMAEDYHQDYATLHPDQPYIANMDLPKIANLKAMFPEVWLEKPTLVFAKNES